MNTEVVFRTRMTGGEERTLQMSAKIASEFRESSPIAGSLVTFQSLDIQDRDIFRLLVREEFETLQEGIPAAFVPKLVAANQTECTF